MTFQKSGDNYVYSVSWDLLPDKVYSQLLFILEQRAHNFFLIFIN